MKKFLSVLIVCFAFVSMTFAQSNNRGGTNYYSSIIGKTLPALGTTGGTALVYVDVVNENDGVVDALTANGFTVTLASDGTDFNTLLPTGGYDLVVLFAQGNCAIATLGISTSAISDYISSGKFMIFATWATDDASIADLFDASFSGSTNLSTVTVTDPTISSGITNPIVLSSGEWGIFSMGLQAINGAEVLGTFENGDAAIVRGNGGKTIMLGYLSDTPPAGERQAIFNNVSGALGANPVPVPYTLIILAFVLIAASVIFTKRKVLFS